MNRRTLMQCNQELADFEVDPTTGEALVIDAAAGGDLAPFAGLTKINGDAFLTTLVKRRAISPKRKDKDDILAAFGAKSTVDLALMGHGLSLTDRFWYRVPGSADRWEDVNFFDNGWDPSFGAAVLSGDYAGLVACSPDVPEVTTPGHAVKAWERGDSGISLIKASLRSDGADLMGAKLASELCALLFDERCYIPLDIAERYGRPCSISPLMLDADEELADGNRLCAMTGMAGSPSLGEGGITAEACDARIGIYEAIGVADASARVAQMACFSCLSLLMDFNSSNFGAIHKVGSDAWRAAPIFDYDGSFGFTTDGVAMSDLCNDLLFAELLCAHRFSFLRPSWDWSWCDPQALVGFEERVVEAYAPYRDLSPAFTELIVRLFAMQRDYVGKVASGEGV